MLNKLKIEYQRLNRNNYYFAWIVALPLAFLGWLLLYILTSAIVSALVVNLFTNKLMETLSVIALVVVVGFILKRYLHLNIIKWKNELTYKVKSSLTDVKTKKFWTNLFATYLLVLITSAVITTLNQGKTTYNQQAIIDNVHNNVAVLIATSLSVSLVAPVFEEIIFRKLITDYFIKFRFKFKYKHLVIAAFIISSTLFGLFHTPKNIFEFLQYTLMGMILYYRYNKYGLAGSISLHMFNNLVGSLFLIISVLS